MRFRAVDGDREGQFAELADERCLQLELAGFDIGDGKRSVCLERERDRANLRGRHLLQEGRSEVLADLFAFEEMPEP